VIVGGVVEEVVEEIADGAKEDPVVEVK